MPSPLVQEITANTNGFQAGMKQAEQSLEGFVNSTKKTGRQANELRKALKESTTEAMNLQKQLSQMSDIELNSDYGRQMQAQFQQAMQAAAEYKDQFQDIQQEINNLASDTKYWDAAKEGIGLVSNGLQGLASVYGLMGGEEKKFQQALVAVNAIESTANTIIGIGNTLQKQSALMVGLRAAKEKLFGVTKAASTAAEVAGTAAITAETTAVGAATTAQTAWNAALLANPIGLVIAAVAGLAAAIYGIVQAFDSQTTAEKQQAEFLDEVNRRMEEQSHKVGDIISRYETLKSKYEECGGSVTKLTEFSKLYGKEIQKLGGDTSSLSKITAFFSTETSNAFIKASFNRANAIAMEQAYAVQLGKVYAKISEIQNRLAKGETIRADEFEEISLNFKDLDPSKWRKQTGFDDFWNGIFNSGAVDVEYVGNNLAADMSDILVQGLEKTIKNLAPVFDKAQADLQKYYDKLTDKHGIDKGRHSALFDDNNKIDTPKVTKSSNKSTKSTQQESTAIQKLDNEIKKLNNDLSDLGQRSDKNGKSIDLLIKKINALKVKKLQIMPLNSLADVENYKKAMQDLISTLPQGSEELATWKEQLIKLEGTIADTKISLVDTNTMDGLKAVKSECERILALLPSGHEDIKKYGDLLKDVNTKLSETEQKINNIKEGIEEGSVAYIKQQISNIDKRLNNENLDVSTKTQLIVDKEKWEQQLTDITKDTPTIIQTVPLKIEFAYKKTPLEQLQEGLEYYKKRFEELSEIKVSTSFTTEEREQAAKELEEVTKQYVKFRDEVKFTEINDDIKNLKKELGDLKLDAFKGVTGVFKDIYGAITDLPEALDECDNAFEGFFTILDSFTGLFENIMGVIDIFKQMQTAITSLSAASVAASQANAAAKKDEAMADASAAAAKTAEQNAGMGPYGWIVGIAAAIAIMATLLSLMKFAGGGIVGGNSFFGDHNLVRVNSGEMILNKRQQAHLFNMIDSGSFGGGGGGTATVKIKGEDLYIALKNHSRRKALSGKSTGIK